MASSTANTEAMGGRVEGASELDANVLAPSNVEGTPEIRLTKKAVEMAKKALARRDQQTEGLRLGVRGGGCSGVSYAIEFAEKIRARDHVFEFDGLKIVIDPKSLIYLRGSILDYEVKLMQHGFKFRNPNEKSGCGCGESFTV
jgi:iron-sulfur cluster assembly protein